MNRREMYLDNSKALSMLLIVLGHCNIRNVIPELYDFICSFHVPIFFIISGMLISNKSFNVRKNIKRYIVPYIVFSALYCLVIKGILFLSGALTLKNFILTTLSEILSQDGGYTACWFLPCLLGAEILMFIEKKKIPIKYLWILNLVIAIICFIIPHDNPYIKGLLRIPVGLFFLTIGNYISMLFKSDLINKKISPIIFGVIFAAETILVYVNGSVDMHGIDFGKSILLYLMNAVGISLCVLFFCKKYLDKNMLFITWFGQNTMPVLCTHQLVIELIWIVDGHTFHVLNNVNGFFSSAIIFVSVLVINVPIVIIFNKYFSALFGNNKTR